jgi:protein TonB
MSAVLGQIRPINIPNSQLYGAQRKQPHYLLYFLLISLLLHGLLLLVHFSHSTRKSSENEPTSLQVVLVNSKSAHRPVKADALAQTSLDGGGNTDAKAVATTPFPLQKDAEPQLELKTRMQQVQEMEQQQARLLSQIKSKPDLALPAPPAQAQPQPGQAPDAVDILTRSLQIARLEAQINREHNAYQSRPKRKEIGARTDEYRFAQYVESWRLKVERVGNLNYPEEARQKKLYGTLQITVNIRSDGSVDSADVVRSSGSKILDQAAIRIIKLAAPYAAFPDDIRKDYDILGITRTWSFTRSDQLASQ